MRFVGPLSTNGVIICVLSQEQAPVKGSVVMELAGLLGTWVSFAASRARIWSASPGLVNSAWIGSSSPSIGSLLCRSVGLCSIVAPLSDGVGFCFCRDRRNLEKSPPRRDPARIHSPPARIHCKHADNVLSDKLVLGDVSEKTSRGLKYELTDHISASAGDTARMHGRHERFYCES